MDRIHGGGPIGRPSRSLSTGPQGRQRLQSGNPERRLRTHPSLKFGLRLAAWAITRRFSIVRLYIVVNLLIDEDCYEIAHHIFIVIYNRVHCVTVNCKKRRTQIASKSDETAAIYAQSMWFYRSYRDR